MLGTPNFAAAVAFFVDGLGFKISDQILKGVATFARIESDHHNLLIHPGPTSYIAAVRCSLKPCRHFRSGGLSVER